MSISQNFPNTRPSLNLNFARSKTLDPRITFIRTQTGNEASYVDESGIIRYSSADEPRFDHDPETGECLGLLVEEQRSNLVTYSSDMSQWTSNGGSFASDDTTAPDGTLTADKLTESSAGSNGHWIEVTISANTTYTVASFIKPTDQPRTRIGVYSNVDSWYGNVDTDWDANGEPTTQNSVGASNIKYEPYPNGWYRVSFQFTSPSTINGTIEYFHQPDRTASGKSAWFWGAQLEADKDYSSYIPTSGSTVTRNSDNVWMDDITDFFNPNEGTSVIKYSPRFDTNGNDQYYLLFGFRDPTTGYRIGFSANGTQLYFTSYTTLLDDGQYTYIAPSQIRNEDTTIAVSYASTYFRIYYNNGLPFSSTSPNYGVGKLITDEYIPHINPSVGITSSNFTTLGFGHGNAETSNRKFNCNIKQFAYYPVEVGVSNARTLSKRP